MPVVFNRSTTREVRTFLSRLRMLTAGVNSTVAVGDNLTVGSTVCLPVESALPASDSFHHASSPHWRPRSIAVPCRT